MVGKQLSYWLAKKLLHLLHTKFIVVSGSLLGAVNHALIDCLPDLKLVLWSSYTGYDAFP